MTDKLQAKFLTPAETILKLSDKILTGRPGTPLAGSSNYHRRLSYQKTRQLLMLAIDDRLGPISKLQRNQIAEAIIKLDELFKKNRRLPRPPTIVDQKKIDFK